MTMITLGVAADETEAGIGANCLWPRTMIATAPPLHLLGGDEETRAGAPPPQGRAAPHAGFSCAPRSRTGATLSSAAGCAPGGGSRPEGAAPGGGGGRALHLFVGGGPAPPPPCRGRLGGGPDVLVEPEAVLRVVGGLDPRQAVVVGAVAGAHGGVALLEQAGEVEVGLAVARTGAAASQNARV